jgi:DNA polymerase-1
MILIFDAEANGLLDTVTKMHCMVTYDIQTKERQHFYTGQKDWIEDSLDYLYGADYLIGHNIINYDLPMLKLLYGWEPHKDTKIVDTYIQSRTQYPDRMRPFGMKGKAGPHGLDAWGYRVGRGKPSYDEWEVFDMEMLHRCSEDVEINELTYHKLCDEGDIDPYNFWGCDAAWLESLRLEHKMQHFINDMQDEGFPVNKELMEHHIVVLADMMQVIEDDVLPSIPATPKISGVVVSKPFKKSGALSKMVTDWTDEDVCGPFSRVAWHQINLGSEKQVKEYLLSIGWKPTTWNFKKVTQIEHDNPSSPYYKQSVGREAKDKDGNKIRSGPKLTEDSFGSLKSDVGKKIANYLQRRHRRSLLEGLVKLVRPDGRISQRISGITSTGRYKHAGIVNIPGTGWYGHEIRECFITSTGYKIIGTDAASCQLRMLAHYMGDPDYIKVVCEGIEEEYVTDEIKIYRGTDVHTRNGLAAGLIDPEWVEHCFGKFTYDLADDDVYNVLCYNRRLAKNFIYGLLFGAGDPKIAETLGCTVRKAKQIRATFMAGLPALKNLLDGLERAYKKGHLLGMDKRKLFVRSPHMMLVYLLQGAEATFMKVAWCFLKLYTGKAGIDCSSVAFVHDEFQDLVREDQVSEYQDCARRAFIQAGIFLKMKCPTAGDPKVGINWRETH